MLPLYVWVVGAFNIWPVKPAFNRRSTCTVHCHYLDTQSPRVLVPSLSQHLYLFPFCRTPQMFTLPLRFPVHPIQPEAPDVWPPAQDPWPESRWARERRPPDHSPGGGRGHGIRGDGCPPPATSPTAFFRAASRLPRPQTRCARVFFYVWMTTTNLINDIIAQFSIIYFDYDSLAKMLFFDFQNHLYGPRSRPSKSWANSWPQRHAVWSIWTACCTKRKPPMQSSWSKLQYV